MTVIYNCKDAPLSKASKAYRLPLKFGPLSPKKRDPSDAVRLSIDTLSHNKNLEYRYSMNFSIYQI